MKKLMFVLFTVIMVLVSCSIPSDGTSNDGFSGQVSEENIEELSEQEFEYLYEHFPERFTQNYPENTKVVCSIKKYCYVNSCHGNCHPFEVCWYYVECIW